MRKLTPLLLVILGLGLGFIAFNQDAAGQTDLAPAAALGSGFTYQGRLDVENTPANGSYDFQFRLFDAAAGGTQVGSTVTVDAVAVSEGLFSVLLDFGTAAFDGQARWLEIAVREGDSDGAYRPLSPLQALSATPYALHAVQAGSVEWTDVQSRPAGLDDGDDDTTYTAGAGLALAGSQFSAQGSPYANVLFVAQSGGDFSSVQAALDSIDDAGASHPYLVYVAPGVYAEQVTLKPYVTLEGAGEGATIIRWTGGSEAPWVGGGSATLIGADNAAVRHLTLESEGAGQTFAVALFNGGASPTISHVTASATGASDTRGVANYSSSSPVMRDVTAIARDGGNNHAVTNDTSTPVMTDVTARASGGDNNHAVLNWHATSPEMNGVRAIAMDGASLNIGVNNNNSSPEMNNVTARASGGSSSRGVYNWNGSSPVMSSVSVAVSDGLNNYGVYNSNASPTMNDVTVRTSGGNTNRGVYNLNGSSPTMTGMSVSATGGVNNDGVLNLNGASPTMSGISITISGGSFVNRGVYNSNASPVMSSIVITASGGTNSIGVINVNASPEMSDVTATTAGATNNYGTYNEDASPVIRHSALEGSTNSIYQEGSGTVKVANSQLIGPVVSGVNCFNNYDQNLAAVVCT